MTRALAILVGLLLLCGAAGPSWAQEDGDLDLSLMPAKELKSLKAKYGRKKARHEKRLPELKKQLSKGNQLIAQDLYPLQARLQKELEAIEKFNILIAEIDSELGSRTRKDPDLKSKKAAARKRVEDERRNEEAARLAARQRRAAEEQSYKTKLELLDAELDRRDSVELDERTSSQNRRRYILVGLAVGLVVLAAGVIVFLKLRSR